ncbi:EH signature domain-containing protein [Proteiniborus sp.]|uniref:EH signature domain-containing protein n=1 Tax=Proteiniborus sp. TaxID=2079015 RepID=UPI0033191CA2
MEINTFRYIPVKTIEARVMVEEKHKTIKEVISKDNNNEEYLLKLINKIVSTSDHELDRLSYKLKNNVLYLLAYYISRNEFKIDIKKIFKILRLRHRKSLMKIYYNSFQQNYTNSEFNNFFAEFLNKENADIHLSVPKGTAKTLLYYLEGGDIIKSMLSSFFRLNIKFEDFIKTFNFNENSKLVIDCKKAFYLYCNQYDYINTDESYLLGIINKLSREEMSEFTANYLHKVDYNNFYTGVLEYIYNLFDTHKNHFFKHYWDKVSEQGKAKFQKWLTTKTMKEFFNEDVRFSFWHSYIELIGDFYLVRSKGQLFLDFGNFVVIEFSKIGNAAYIYDKEVYNKYFAKYALDTNSVNNSALKNENIAIKRIIHSGNWQYNTARSISHLVKEI